MSTEGAPVELAAFLEDLRPIDHHCHGVVSYDLDRPAFELLLNEGFDPPPAGTSHLDSPVGLAIRRWCAPALGLEPHASLDAYVERRAELGREEVDRRLLGAARLGGLVIETGYRSSDVLGPAGMHDLAGVPAYEVLRLETVAEAVAETRPSAAGYADTFREALGARSSTAVGLKTIAAYRGGFAFDPAPPSTAEVTDAAGHWLGSLERDPPRLTDPVLLRFGIWAGAELARERHLPIQFHTGWGDPDLTLHLANPSLLTDLLKALGRMAVNVVLLHCYPYHREAAFLATVLPNVSFDIGEALTYLGPSSRGLLTEALELAPFTKQLYSSDAFGVSELHLLGAAHFRSGLTEVLGRWVADGDASLADVEHIATAIAVGNAERIYPFARGG
jgi:predicted TIM-barrel fold metal-dependent hydrolase